MKDYQDAQFKMFLEVSNFFDINPNLTKENVIIKKHDDKLKTFIEELKANIKKQEIDTSGYASQKKKAKSELSKLIFNLTASLRSFATDTNNDPLFKEFDVSQTDIKRMKDVELVNYANTVQTGLKQNEKGLKPYGITAEDLVNLSNETTDFEKLLLQPAEQRKQKTVATANIKKLISETLKLLKNSLDNDMVQFEDEQADLYAKYLELRKIDDNKTTSLSIKGTVTDTDTGEVLEYVKVTVKFKAGAELSDKVKSSTHIGNFQFKNLPEGKCTVTFEKNYYQTITVDSEVHTGRFTRLDIKMKKSE